jgi:uncharacterized membrane protein
VSDETTSRIRPAPRPRAASRVSRVTHLATTLTLMVIAATAGFLIGRFPRLPPMLPVHLDRGGFPDRWAAKTYPLVLMPVFVQVVLFAIFATIATLLLWRARSADAAAEPDPSHRQADDERMRTAGEAVALLGLIWIAFQGLAALRVVRLWESSGGTLGTIYAVGLLAAILASLAVATRAVVALGRTGHGALADGRHWRFGGLYVNPADPALFVPTRDGTGYTLNFGRRAAVALLAVVVVIGLALPVLIIRALTR